MIGISGGEHKRENEGVMGAVGDGDCDLKIEPGAVGERERVITVDTGAGAGGRFKHPLACF